MVLWLCKLWQRKHNSLVSQTDFQQLLDVDGSYGLKIFIDVLVVTLSLFSVTSNMPVIKVKDKFRFKRSGDPGTEALARKLVLTPSLLTQYNNTLLDQEHCGFFEKVANPHNTV